MRKVASRILGRDLNVPYPETIPEIRNLCASENDFLVAARHGFMQKLSSYAAYLAQRSPRLSDAEIEKRLDDYIYSSFNREERT